MEDDLHFQIPILLTEIICLTNKKKSYMTMKKSFMTRKKSYMSRKKSYMTRQTPGPQASPVDPNKIQTEHS